MSEMGHAEIDIIPSPTDTPTPERSQSKPVGGSERRVVLPSPENGKRQREDNLKIREITAQIAGIKGTETPDVRYYDGRGVKGRTHPDKEVAERIKKVKDGLLPQDREGRVTTIGGVCNEAIEDLEAVAGDPGKWTMEDLNRPEVRDLLSIYQGFEDLLMNRTMHGPQTRAIQRIVARQQEIDERKARLTSRKHEQVEAIAKALEQGIGQEEVPYDRQLQARIPWVSADTVRNAEDFASFVESFKSGLDSTDNDRFAKPILTERSGRDTATGVPFGKSAGMEEEEDKKMKTLLQVIFNFLLSLFSKKPINETQK